MNFQAEVGHWPNSAASRFVSAGGLDWHVQETGSGPALLLVHGTGASTHSWRKLVPLLRQRFRLIMPDLPGHAFSSAPTQSGGYTLPGMARALSMLMRELGVLPVIAAGHSAGAAILLRAALDGSLTPQTIVSLNGALFPFGGIAGQVFSPLAKLMVSLPFVPKFMTWRADRAAVERLLRDMGPSLEDQDIAFYARLFRDEAHVASTLAMMANWDLAPLVRDLPRLEARLTLVTAEGDNAVPPADARRAATLVPGSRLIVLPECGHLAHEERPQAVAELIQTAANQMRR
jgi:magnesium chelatase accessory protein